LNSLEENALMSEGLAARARQTGQSHAAARFETRARGSREQAETIRRVLVDGKSEARRTRPPRAGGIPASYSVA
ncbi:MAG: hypothetical protein M3R38_30130, partial [Actinomycetota bacterium]|nr:hypothetical protein [Actinomycetota bacterium]